MVAVFVIKEKNCMGIIWQERIDVEIYVTDKLCTHKLYGVVY